MKRKEECGCTKKSNLDHQLRMLEVRADGIIVAQELRRGNKVERAVGVMLRAMLLQLEGEQILFEISPEVAKQVNEAADAYAKDGRTTDQPKITKGFTSATTAVPPNNNPNHKNWSALTTEVDCCWDACLLEIVYGIESTFGTDKKASDPKKKGKDGAYGPFQLDKETAKEAGLTVNKETDERLDLQKAADAAAQTLFRLGRSLTFKDPGKCDCCTPKPQAKNSQCCDDIRKLLLIGYNCGLGVLKDARKRAKNPCAYADVKDNLDAALAQTDNFKDKDKRAKKLKEATDYVEKYDLLKRKLCPAY